MVTDNSRKSDPIYVPEPDGKDEKATKRARRFIKQVRKQSQGNDIELTEWEDEFLNSLDERLGKYGKAFCDPDLGAMNAPLSLRQGLKLIELKKKSGGNKKLKASDNSDNNSEAEDAPKIYSTFKNKKPALNKSKSGFKIKKPLKAKKPLMRKSPLRNFKPNS